MQVTSVRIQKVFSEPDKMLAAVASITVDNMLAIHNIRLLKTSDRMFVAMPNLKLSNNTYKDMVHPINEEGRRIIEEAVISAYNNYINNADASAEA